MLSATAFREIVKSHWPVGRMKFASLETNWGGDQGFYSLPHSFVLFPPLREESRHG